MEQLKRQLVFLRNSASAYDAGHVEEAVRIGVVIRVLCHDAMEVMDGIPSGHVKTLLAIKEALEQGGVQFVGAPDDSPGVRLTQLSK